MAAPWWLVGLLLVPLIRWLHRGGAQRRALVVAHLGLWSTESAASHQPQPRQPPDPAWRRRAALVALLLLALAGPRWPAASHAVVLWVDDTPSLLLREGGGTRLELGLAAARQALAGHDGPVQVRAQSDPWRDRASAHGGGAGALDAELAADLTRQIEARWSPAGDPAAAASTAPAPPAALLVRDPAARHWLLTDGTRPGAAAWQGAPRPPDRVLRVGEKDRNVGLLRLSARRLDAAGMPPGAVAERSLAVLVGVHNGGRAVEWRELVLQGPGRELQRLPLTLAPGRTQWLNLKLPAGPSLRARLLPADDLPQDDLLELDARALQPAAVAVDPRCPAALPAALAAHPGLAQPGAGRPAEARLACGPDADGPQDLPTLHLMSQGPARRTSEPWQPLGAWRELPDPAERAQGLPVRGPLPTRPGDEVGLLAGSEPLLVQRSGPPRQVLTALDLAAWSADPAAPLWLNRMLERVLDRPLLDAVTTIGRLQAAVQVAPETVAATQADPRSAASAALATQAPPSSTTRRWLVGLAALLLAIELLRSLRRHRLRQADESAAHPPGRATDP